MDNKEKTKLFLDCAKYCMRIENYEKAKEFIHHAQKLYPTEEAEEMLCAINGINRKEKAEQSMMDYYELELQFINNVLKLYPRKEAKELLAEVLSEKKQPELADQEQRQERNSDFNFHWSKKERWQKTSSHEYYENFTNCKFEANMTDMAALILGVGLGIFGTGLLVKNVFDVCDQLKKNKY